MPQESDWRERLFDHASDIVCVVDFDNNLLDINPAVTRALGWEVDEVKNSGFLELIHPDDVEASREAIFYVTGGGEKLDFENRCRAKDGTYRWLNWAAFPDLERRVVYTIGRDVTDRKCDQDTERQVGGALDQVAKFESLQIMAAGLAHDFNNTITGILGYLTLLSVKTKDNPEWQQGLTEIRNLTNQATSLSNQLLAYAGHTTVFTEDVDLNSLIEDMQYELEFTRSDNIAIEVELGDNVPPLAADPNQVRQLVLNLVVNAVEALGDGPGKITLETGSIIAEKSFWQPRMTDRQLAPGEYATITVTDNGPGIDSKTAGKIFDPFFSTKIMGRGLGLAQVQGIARGHQGVVLVETAEGQGSKFVVMMPCANAETRAQVVYRAAPESEEKGRVLVIDDEKAIREMLKYLLGAAGYEVHAARHGAEGIKVLEKLGHAVDLAIVDFHMPYIDGVETAARLRKLRPDLPIVLSSGYPPDSVPDSFLTWDQTAFLQKPYRPSDLLGMVRSMLVAARDAKTG